LHTTFQRNCCTCELAPLKMQTTKATLCWFSLCHNCYNCSKKSSRSHLEPLCKGQMVS